MKKTCAITLIALFLFTNINASEKREYTGYYKFLGAQIDIYKKKQEKDVNLGPNGSLRAQMDGSYEGKGSLHEHMKPENNHQTEMEKLRIIALNNKNKR